MRFPITLILLACTSLAMAQSTKIDEEERARLENQFKALKTFYINDDGLVVYQTPKDNSSESSVQETYPQRGTETFNNVPETNYNETKDTNILDVNQRNYSTPGNTGTFSISKQVVDPSSFSTSDLTESQPTEAKKTVTLPTVEPVDKTKIDNLPKKPIEKKQEKKESAELDKSTKTEPKPSTKKSVFQKAPPKYKNLEEAAMAVDDLLEKLKKEQAQNSSSGSMSSRIARGAGKSTLRKQTISDSDYINNTDELYDSRGVSPVTELMIDKSADQHTPTYYINGQQVEKAEVDKLRKKDIISREIRTRNTVSENPAGEVWLEVRENRSE